MKREDPASTGTQSPPSPTPPKTTGAFPVPCPCCGRRNSFGRSFSLPVQRVAAPTPLFLRSVSAPIHFSAAVPSSPPPPVACPCSPTLAIQPTKEEEPPVACSCSPTLTIQPTKEEDEPRAKEQEEIPVIEEEEPPVREAEEGGGGRRREEEQVRIRINCECGKVTQIVSVVRR